MTDANGDRPLTRRQLRERERAAEAARGGSGAAAESGKDTADLTDLADEPVRVGRHSIPSVPATPQERSAAEEAARSVPGPSSARGKAGNRGGVQSLDTVDDAEVDRIEIDEAPVPGRRISAAGVSESTQVELEDKRTNVAPAEEPAPTGPTRGGSQRLPVIVNVVSDTSEHHIADLREQGVAGSGGASSASFTANALVLPAGSETGDFQLEGDDGILVTGSIDVPEGFATSGRGRAAIDGNDVDDEIADGEVPQAENAPVRASSAVSSHPNAHVQIAPTKAGRNVMPLVVGGGAGVFVLGVVGIIVVALTQGWF